MPTLIAAHSRDCISSLMAIGSDGVGTEVVPPPGSES